MAEEKSPENMSREELVHEVSQLEEQEKSLLAQRHKLEEILPKEVRDAAMGKVKVANGNGSTKRGRVAKGDSFKDRVNKVILDAKEAGESEITAEVIAQRLGVGKDESKRNKVRHRCHRNIVKYHTLGVVSGASPRSLSMEENLKIL
jgi:hypothetical protein